MDKKVNYGHLGKVLENLGYHSEDLDEDHLVFRKPDHRLFILLPKMPAQAVVRPIDMLHVRTTLVNDGLIKKKNFDSLFMIKKGDRLLWNEPETGREVKVTAAAGESDGLVVIRRNGTLVPCPVDQLRKASDVESDAGNRRRERANRGSEQKTG